MPFEILYTYCIDVKKIHSFNVYANMYFVNEVAIHVKSISFSLTFELTGKYEICSKINLQ